MTEAVPTVSVVIPTHNRDALIRALVTTLTDLGGATEIIVVDDGSTDGTWATLTELSSSTPLRPIRTANRGAAGARQVGVEAARSDVVLLLDDDVVASPGLVRGHAARHAGTTGLVVVGYMPTMVASPPALGAYASTIYAESYLEHCAEWARDPSTILTTLWMGNISMRRNDALRVGMLSTRVNGYHADRDFGLRCLRSGLTAVFDRSLLATHAHRRDLVEFIRDSVDQGASRHAIYAVHSDILGSGDGFYVKGLGRVATWVVAQGCRPRVGRVLQSVVAGVVRTATLVRAPAMELRWARFLGRISAQHGYAVAARAARQTSYGPHR